jgi:hypothetical protein
MVELKCPVCNKSWIDETLVSSKIRNDLLEEMKVNAPCGHGFAFLIRQYDLTNDVWYYEQIDFVKKT